MDVNYYKGIYSGTSLKRTPLGPNILSVIKGCPLLRGYASHSIYDPDSHKCPLCPPLRGVR